MDQFTGGGNSGFDAPQAAPVYAPVQAPPRAGKRKLWLWIAGGAALVVLVIVLALCLAPGGAGGEEPWPVLFTEDGDVYLAAGTETIRLDDAAFAPGDSSYLNAMVSADGKTLYYLADVSGSSGEGDLMRIALGSANAEPEIIAEDVYSAQISADGKKILYLSDVENDAGDLFLCTPGGKAEMIDESVWSGAFGFSPGGGLFCYTLVDGSGDQTLMLYAGGNSTEVMDADDEAIWSLDVDDSGRVVFETYSFGDNGITLYVYANGKAERISRNARYILTFGRADEFLYTTDDRELVYYAQGDEERITDEYGGISLTRYHRDPRESYDRQFVFMEAESGTYTGTLYEVSLPGKPVKIGKADSSCFLDEGFRYCAYEYNDTLYLVKKSGGGWGSREKVCENPYYFSMDESGRYLYYIACEDENSYSGDFCRLPLAGGEEEVLLDDVTGYLLSGGKVYARNEDGEAYLVAGERKQEQIGEDISSFYAAAGGIYMAGSDGELYYYDGGEAERLSRDASVINLYGGIASAYN